MNREAIYSAIWALAPVNQFVTYSRRLKPYDALKPAQYPALFQAQSDEQVKRMANMPPAIDGQVNWWLYAYTDPAGTKSPAEIINPLVDACENALAATEGYAQTLGGLVSQCWIEGTIKTDEGLLDNYSVAVIPIRFTTGGA